MKLGMKMAKETKETLLGGVAGALTVNMESAANALVAGYPQIFKDRLVPQIPRNGELLSVITPVGVTWAISKKKHSSRVHNVRNGVMFYDLPKLMDLFVYRIAYSMGLPTQSASMRFNGNTIRFSPPIVNSKPMVNKYTAPQAGGKYVMKTNSAPQMTGGIGKYR